MKKVMAFLLVVILIVGAIPTMAKTQREVWVPSPGITCGVTSDEIMFNKAVHSGDARLYKLSSVGERYYLGVIEEQVTDGGSNGKKKTSYLTYYSLLETEDSFIILGKTGVNNEYLWDGLEGVRNISGYIDTEYYTDKGYEAPYYIINPHNKYTYSKWDEYIDYIFIGSNGGIAKISDWCDYGQARYPMIFENKLYTGQNMYYSDERGYYFYLSDGTTKATQRRIVGIKNGAMVNIASPASVAADSITTANGYKKYSDGMSGDTLCETYYSFSDDSGRFFKYNYTYSSTHKAYVCNVKVYQNINGVMTVVSEGEFSTGMTSKPTDTPTTIDSIDETAYTSIGMSPPLFKIGNGYILKNGKCAGFLSDEIGTNYKLCVYNGRIAIVRNTIDDNYIYYKNESGTYKYWQRINYLNFTDNGIELSEDIDLVVGAHDNLDGYYSSYSSFVSCGAFSSVSAATLKKWWTHYLDNKFSDGRYVAGHWVGMGNSMYEIWYDIYDKDGTLISTGPSGFSTTASSSLYVSALRAFVINDTKIILALATVSNSWFNEYYRAAVVTENDDGIVEVPQPLGKKNILTSEDADTTPIDEVVDFAADDLPLAFNIKENVVGTDKFNPDLREQVNTIRLDGVVIVTKEGYISGKQNTGVTLDTFDEYDYTFGDSPVRIYTNGQYLCWYCSEPENLKEGTYNVSYSIGDITICGVVKVIAPPTNDSATTVVF